MKFSGEQKKLFSKNRRLFAKHFGGLLVVLDQAIPSNIELYDSDSEIDVVINGSRFYGVDAKAYAEKQIEAYIEKPGIIEMVTPSADPERTPTHFKWLKRFDKALRSDVSAVFIDRSRIDVGTTFLFGIGLGFHIYPLLVHTRCRELVISEPEPVFLRLSCYFIDWTKIFKTLKGRITFVFDRQPDDVFTSFRWVIHFKNPGVQQCLFHYQHYWEPTLSAIHRNFMEKSNLFFDGLGFYDDEKTMTRNHLLNTYMDDWVMCTKQARSLPFAAVLVGAGPSLKDDLGWLYENRENLLIFSAGSSLQALLRNNIIPDFHVEIENIPMNYDIISPLFSEYDLSDVVLICSSTIDTKTAHLFSRRIWFMREGVMATTLHGGGDYCLNYQNPTVINTAMAAALQMGFRDILLLGADFGTRNENEHHTPGTSYETMEQLKSVTFKYPDKVKANFGGECFTNTHMLNGLNSIKKALEHTRTARVFNGSNGAAIPKTIPIKSRSFKYTHLSMSKSEFVKNLYNNSDHMNWAEILGESVFEDMKSEFSEYCASAKKIVKENSYKNKDFIVFLSSFYSGLTKLEGVSSKYNPAVTGSVSTITMIILYWWRRTFDDKLIFMERLSRRYWYVFFNILEKDFAKFLDDVRQELPLVRPDLFDDKSAESTDGSLSVTHAE